MSESPTAPSKIEQWPAAMPEYASLHAAVQGEAARWNVPGMAAGVLLDGKIETTTTGMGSLLTGQPVVEETVFQIGSISKIFTTTLAIMLVQDGLLELDKPIQSYLPDLPFANETTRTTVTLRHLLSHQGGFEGDRMWDYGRGDDALRRSIADFDTLPRWSDPGRHWMYCNTGFHLTGRVIEAVTEKPFETVMGERVFEPLGLKHTTYFPEIAITWPHSVGHLIPDRDAGHHIARPYTIPRHRNPSGGIISTIPDLLRFAQFHMQDGEIDGKRLLRKDLAQAMQTPLVEAGNVGRSYGLGWSIWDLGETQMVDHGGATQGFRAHLGVVPQRGFALAQLTNSDHGAFAMPRVQAWTLRHYRGLEKLPAPFIALEPSALDELTGTYERHNGTQVVTREGGTLRLDITSKNERTGVVTNTLSHVYEPIGERRFRIRSGPWAGNTIDVIDDTDEDGSPRRLVRYGGRLAGRPLSADTESG